MTRNLAMTGMILLATMALLEGFGSCDRTEPVHDSRPDQSVDAPKEEAHEVKITINRIIKPKPVQRVSPPRRDKPAVAPPPPPPPPPLTSPAFTPAALDFLNGERLLTGGFPRLRATYERVGFPAYRDAVLALGGEFFLWDGKSNQPVAHLDVRTGEMSDADLAADLSRWPRDVTKHLKELLGHGKARFGERASHIVLLPPSRLDAALLSGLDHLLTQNGVDPGSVSGFFGAYELRGRRLYCVVVTTYFKDGTERPVSFSIDLGGAFL